MINLSEKYQKEVKPKLVKEFKLTTHMATPKIEKVIVNMGIGEESKDKAAIKAFKKDLATITGQV
ncbi:unnamed protein product, partial [marine sediment metagenome]